MPKRMLVPLDLTARSESVLPVVADIARGGGATVRLLHVAPYAESVIDADGNVLARRDEEAARLETEALDYLSTVEAQLDGVPVECAVRFGDPVLEILLEAESFGADLIVLAARSTEPGSALRVGAIADHVCRRAEVALVVHRSSSRFTG